MISKMSLSSDSQAGCMQILSKDREMGGRERERGGSALEMASCDMDSSFLSSLSLSFPHPELFCFFLFG